MLRADRWCPRCEQAMAWSKLLRPGARYAIRACIRCGSRTTRIKRGRFKPKLPRGLATFREKVKVADELWRQYIYLRAPFKLCVCCGKKRPLQAAHYMSRRFKLTRWDPENGLPLCGGCHRRMTSDHVEHEEFFTSYLGASVTKRLRRLARSRGKPDVTSAIVVLKELLVVA